MIPYELTDDEFRKFLDEIEREDEDILEEGRQAEARLQELSECSEEDTLAEEVTEDTDDMLLEEKLQDKAWTVDKLPTINKNGEYEGTYVMGAPVFTVASENPRTSPEYYSKIIAMRREAAQEAIAKKTQATRARKIGIQRLALDQDIVCMADIIPVEQLQMLIASLTKEHTRMIDKYKEYIDRRFTRLLRPMIPRKLLQVYREYPYSVHRCPGFLYTASREFGKELPYWVRPDIPYYFEQGTEVALIKSLEKEYLFGIDYSIERLHYHQNERREKELSYAARLAGKRNFTYFSLLKLNPYWWEHLYNILKEKHDYQL